MEERDLVHKSFNHSRDNEQINVFTQHKPKGKKKLFYELWTGMHAHQNRQFFRIFFKYSIVPNTSFIKMLGNQKMMYNCAKLISKPQHFVNLLPIHKGMLMESVYIQLYIKLVHAIRYYIE